jgi:hypothetical protein
VKGLFENIKQLFSKRLGSLGESKPPPVDLRGIDPAGALRRLRARKPFGPIPIEAATLEWIHRDLDRLAQAATAAHAALIANRSDALAVAAQWVAHCHYIHQYAWIRAMVAEGAGCLVGTIHAALAADVEPLKAELGRRLARRPAPKLIRRGSDYVLACAACGVDAVTFRVAETTIEFHLRDSGHLLPGTVRFSSPGSGVHVATWPSETPSGYDRLKPPDETARQLRELLTRKDSRAAVDFLAALPTSQESGPGLRYKIGEAYCPQCERVYCLDHFAWKCCPLGHAPGAMDTGGLIARLRRFGEIEFAAREIALMSSPPFELLPELIAACEMLERENWHQEDTEYWVFAALSRYAGDPRLERELPRIARQLIAVAGTPWPDDNEGPKKASASDLLLLFPLPKELVPALGKVLEAEHRGMDVARNVVEALARAGGEEAARAIEGELERERALTRNGRASPLWAPGELEAAIERARRGIG